MRIIYVIEYKDKNGKWIAWETDDSREGIDMRWERAKKEFAGTKYALRMLEYTPKIMMQYHHSWSET